MATVDEIKDRLTGGDLDRKFWNPERSCRTDEKEAAREAIGIKSKRRYKGGRKTVIDTEQTCWAHITHVKSGVSAWWEYNSYPYVLKGVRLFLKERRKEIWDYVAEANRTLAALAVKMDEKREWFVEDAKKELGPAWEDGMIPPSWKGLFRFDIRDVNIDPPSYLEKDEYFQAQEQLRAAISTSMGRFEGECWRQMADLSNRLVGTLDTGNVRSTSVEAFGRLFGRVSQMKFEGTAAFKRAVAEAEEILKGADAADLRASKKKREATKEKLTHLVNRYQQLQEAIQKKNSPESEEAAQT